MNIIVITTSNHNTLNIIGEVEFLRIYVFEMRKCLENRSNVIIVFCLDIRPLIRIVVIHPKNKNYY